LTACSGANWLFGGDAYTLMLSNEGFTLAVKGRRKGLDVRWEELLSGEADLLGNHRIVLA